MNKKTRLSIARRLSDVLDTMTEQEVFLARNHEALGISPAEASKLVDQMSHNSSMLAEIRRDLVGVK